MSGVLDRAASSGSGPTSCPASLLAASWGEGPLRNLGPIGGAPVRGAAWRLAADHRIEVPQIGSHLICVALSGASRHALWLDGREAGAGYAPPGSVRIVPAGVHAQVEVDGLASAEGHFAFFHFYAPPQAFGELGLSARLDLRRPGAGEVDPWLHALARHLAELGRSGAPSALEAEHLALAALARISERYRQAPAGETTPTRGGLAPWQTKRVKEYIEAHLTRQLTVSELAQVCGLSLFHFARAFHQSVGRPPHAFVTLRRLEVAARLLDETTQTVTEIALAVGYAESSHLARAFKRVYRMGPAEYRRRR